jgi:preprotein translocase subunit SecA
LISIIKRLLGNNDYLQIRRIKGHLKEIDRYYKSIKEKNDNELAELTDYLKKEVQIGNTDKLRCQAFALVKEAVRRVLGITMHDVQLIGGWVLADGKIAEMATGEGKTIVSTLPAYWFALQGKGVHVITVNEYLAKRDYEEMGKVFKFLGLSVGLNLSGYSEQDKRAAYQKDITYGICNEFGFDYLRDHLVLQPDRQVQRPLAFAIIDEVDSVLIDEARTPLIIAGKTKAAPDLYYICARFVEGLREGKDYEIDRETKQVMFTETAIHKIEATFMLENLYDLENTSVYHYLLQSLRAKTLMQRDVDYIVSDQQVKIIDAFTGRILEGRNFSDGLHQAIEAKENVPLSEENRTHAVITVQKFFSLYERIAGMTGTIKTEEEEIGSIYGLEVISIPTHKPVVRKDYEDVVFLTKEEKYASIIKEIQERHRVGQPVLVGTTSIQQSEEIAERLKQINLPFQLLNAKKEKEEAEIIAKAGLKGAITIATNMAGRGTDIRLGQGVAELGGLHVIGTERHESRRVDNQLRGRSGRQGDPGSSQFFLSLEDELIERFAYEEALTLREKWRWGENGTSDEKVRAFIERVQKQVEQQMFEIRSLVFRLDTVIHEQREMFYCHRDQVLAREEIEELIKQHTKAYFSDLVSKYCPEDKLSEEWNVSGLLQKVGMQSSIDIREIYGNDDVSNWLLEAWENRWHLFLSRQDIVSWRQRWHQSYLRIIDWAWVEHIEILDQVKQGIHYRAYANRHPVEAYREEAWELYARMEQRVRERISQQLIQEVNNQLQQPVKKTG